MKKVALIIGGSSGIGLATVDILTQNGYDVYNGSRRVCPNAKAKSGFVDVAQLDSISPFIDEVINKSKQLDLLVYNAGFSMASPIENVKKEDYRYLFNVNFFGAIEAIKAVVPIMKRQNAGRIILISSIASVFPILFDPYYCASKAALDMLVKTLTPELKSNNIKITSVLPGGVRTAFSYKRKIEAVAQANKTMNNAAKALCFIEQRGLTAQAVAQTVYNVSQMNCPPTIIASGILNKFLILTHKITPNKLITAISRKIFCTKY